VPQPTPILHVDMDAFWQSVRCRNILRPT